MIYMLSYLKTTGPNLHVFQVSDFFFSFYARRGEFLGNSANWRTSGWNFSGECWTLTHVGQILLSIAACMERILACNVRLLWEIQSQSHSRQAFSRHPLPCACMSPQASSVWKGNACVVLSSNNPGALIKNARKPPQASSVWEGNVCAVPLWAPRGRGVF